MSGICGIFNLNGAPVDPDTLDRMIDSMAYQGPDGAGRWINGPAGLGHRMLWTTPEAVYEKQPWTDETDRLSLVFDGRVDNRRELKDALEGKGAILRNDTDAELILRAYETWGEACPSLIIGDFVFAIWDGSKQQVFCARDHLGIKPFYYYLDHKFFVFGSDLRLIFEDARVPREPNEGMIGEYLAAAPTGNEETLYQNILRLQAAHCLIVRPGFSRKERYWDFDLNREIRYRTDAEYAEHFREIFEEAVRCRMRAYGPVGAELSGGLDSSSVVAMVQAIRQKEGCYDPGFETFSLVFPGLECDESAYIDAVVQMWNLKSNRCLAGIGDSSTYAGQVKRSWDFPDFPNGEVMAHQIWSLAHRKGMRILLSGQGGDHWLTGSLFHYADLVRQLRFGSIFGHFCQDHQYSSWPKVLREFLRYGIYPFLPVTMDRFLRKVLRKGMVLPPWINSEFALNVKLKDRLCKKDAKGRQKSFARRDIYSLNANGWQSLFKEKASQSAAWYGMEMRHPFFDKRVAQFAMALPEIQRSRGILIKFVLREAMKGLLPEIVRQRTTKADFSHLFAETCRKFGREKTFSFLSAVSPGWVDRTRAGEINRLMQSLYDASDEEYISFIWKFWMIYGVDLWYRSMFLCRDSLIQEGSLRCTQAS